MKTITRSLLLACAAVALAACASTGADRKNCASCCSADKCCPKCTAAQCCPAC